MSDTTEITKLMPIAEALTKEETLTPKEKKFYHQQASKFYKSGLERHAYNAGFRNYIQSTWNWTSFWIGMGFWGIVNFLLIGGWRLVNWLLA